MSPHQIDVADKELSSRFSGLCAGNRPRVFPAR